MKKSLNIYDENVFIPSIYGLALASIAHVIFLILFYVNNLQPLFLLNIFSVFLYIGLLLYVWYTKNILPAMIGAALELIVHQVAIVYFLGWGYGFEYYLFVIPSFVLFGAFQNKLIPITLATLSIVILISLKLFSLDHTPTLALDNVKELLSLVNLVLTAVPIAIFSGIFAFNSYKKEATLLAAHEELYVAATYDPLTGLRNRAQGLAKLEELYSEHNKKEANYVLAIADIDNFKSINDKYGHHNGDFVLQSVANRLKDSLKENGHVFRWGGEEFLILLPEQTLSSGHKVLERLLEVSSKEITLEQDKVFMTITIGAIESNHRPNDELMRLADKALYSGKKSGKNCLIPVLK